MAQCRGSTCSVKVRAVVREQVNAPHAYADTPVMLALSIRQPYAELILRGVKTVEYRSRPTRVIGKRFAIYAARRWAGFPGHDRLIRAECSGPHPSPPPQGRGRESSENTSSPIHPVTPEGPGLVEGDLPTGLLVGSAVISDCIYKDGWWEWRLTGVRRYRRPRRLPAGARPQPVWFRAA